MTTAKRSRKTAAAKSTSVSGSAQLYRLAVYGRMASGKTCILAALAMDHGKHPLGLTCEWVEDPVELCSKGLDGHDLSSKTRHEGFLHGRDWLKQAIALLLSGKVAKPTPPSPEPMRFLYRFSIPEHHTYWIELIDYSGELIDPAIATEDLAKRLHGHLKQTDGILVVAEAPRCGHDMEPLSDELLKLRQAFAILQLQRKGAVLADAPVGLLVSKWDRRGGIDYLHPSDARDAVLKFLESEPEPPHRPLVDTLRNSVPSEDFEVFAVSALGPCEIIQLDGERIERPTQAKPLKSFGLEDGFIWACRRRDAIDLNYFERASQQLSWWRIWQTWGGLPGLTTLPGRGRRLRSRLVPKSQETTRLKTARSRVRRVSLLHLMILVFTFCFTAEALQTVAFDWPGYNSGRAIIENPKATREELDRAANWFENYYTSPGWRHLLSRAFFSAKDAHEKVTTLRGLAEESSWQQVERESDPLVQEQLALKYTQEFPSGSHRDEASRLVATIVKSREYARNLSYLSDVKERVDAVRIPPNANAEQLKNTSETLEKYRQSLVHDKLPFPNSANQDVDKLSQSLHQQISKMLLDVAAQIGNREWVAFREDVYQLIRDEKIPEAASKINKWDRQDTEWQALSAYFRLNILPVLRRRVDSLVKDQRFDDARKAVRGVRDHPDIPALVRDDLKKIDELLGGIDRREDALLYEEVRKYKDLTYCDKYLNNAPVKKMEQKVKGYRKYLEARAAAVEMGLSFDGVTWGQVSKGYLYSFTAFVNTAVTIEGSARGAPTERSGAMGSGKFTGKADEMLELRLRVVRQHYWSWQGDKAIVDKSFRVTPAHIGGGKDFELGGEGEDFTATLSVSGIPDEPPLPPSGD